MLVEIAVLGGLAIVLAILFGWIKASKKKDTPEPPAGAGMGDY